MRYSPIFWPPSHSVSPFSAATSLRLVPHLCSGELRLCSGPDSGLSFLSRHFLAALGRACVRARILSGLTKHARLPSPTARRRLAGRPSSLARAWPFRFRCGVATVISRSRATADVPKQKKAPGGRSLSSPKKKPCFAGSPIHARTLFLLPWCQKNCVVRGVRCTGSVFRCDLLKNSRRAREAGATRKKGDREGVAA